MPPYDRRKSESDLLEDNSFVSHERRKSSSSGLLYASNDEIEQALSSTEELGVQSETPKVARVSRSEDRRNRFSRTSTQSGTTISSNDTLVYNGPGQTEVTV